MRSRAALAGSVLAFLVFGGLTAVAPRTGAAPAPPAFPGADGFGAGATGGRGGRVVIVTSLEPSGSGSLNEALAPPCDGPRFVVFDVSGVIAGDIDLRCGDVTIAGQTAPGAGITIAGRLIGEYADDLVGGDYPLRNIIIRHLRIRPPPLTAAATEDRRQVYDALNLSRASRIVLDHVTTSWASDETIDLYEAMDVTVQWSTLEESNPVPPEEGSPHNYGLIVGEDIRHGQRVSIHHVMFAHHQSRTPAVAHGPAEIVNNVSYDVRVGFVHDNAASGEFHIIGNTYKQGPGDDDLVPFFFNDEDSRAGDNVRPSYFVSQNHIIDLDPPFDAVVDGVPATYQEDAFDQNPELVTAVISSAGDFSAASPGHQPITVESPQAAFESVLARAGAFPRDGTTRRIVEEVRTGGGGWAPHPPADLLEGLTQGAPRTDADRDGIADDWESANRLDPSNGADSRTPMQGGYTAIEVYVNGLSDALVGSAVPQPGASSGPVASAGAAPAPSRAAPADTARPAATGSPSTGSGWTTLLALVAAVLSAFAAVMSATSVYILRHRHRRERPPPET